MIQYILGRAGSGKTETVLSRIAALIPTDTPLLLLVPEQFSFETERALHSRLGVRDAARVQVLSFTRLADRILRETGGIATTVMDDVTRALLMSMAVETAAAPENNDGEERRRTGQRSTDYLTALLALCTECKQCAVSPRMLALTANALPDGTLRRKLTDYADLFGIYDALAATAGIDPADYLQIAAEKLPDCRLWEGAAIFVDGFKGFTASELTVLQLLMQRADVTVSLCTPTEVADDCDLFSPVAHSLRQLQTLADQHRIPRGETVILRENHRAETPALRTLEQNAFAARPTVFEEAAGEVTVTPCPDIHEECAAVARTVRRLLRTSDMRARDIAVIVRNLGGYRGILDAALRREGVPCYIDTASDVYTAPLISLLLSALRIAVAGFSTEELLRMLKTDILPFDEIAVARLENYVYLWRIDGEQWTRPFTANPAGLVEERRRDYAALGELEDLRRRLISPLQTLRGALAAGVDGKAFATAVYTYLTAVEADAGVRALFTALVADGEPAIADTTARLWDSVMELLDRFATVFSGRCLPPARFSELFHLAAGLLKLTAVPQSPDAVQIGSADHVRLSSPRAVFLLGANEGVFPAYPTDGDLLSDRDREVLEEAGLYLSGSRLQKAAEERFFAYLALSAPREALYISYLETVEKEAAVPSSLVETVRRILPQHTRGVCRLPDGSDIESPAEAFDRLAALYGRETPLAAALREALAEHTHYAAFSAALNRVVGQEPFSLSAPVASALFGTDMQLSASQTDSFYQCRFRYFCQYGMRLQTRRVADVDASLFGTLTHYLLETLLPQYIGEQPAAAGAAAPPTVSDLQKSIHETLFRYIEEHLGGLQNRPARFLYLLSLVERTCFSLLWFTVTEMAQSRFSPADYELVIGRDGIPSPQLPLDSGRGSVHIVGKVDRVDIYRRGDTTFVRVVDYKTGKKEFKLREIPYGINMQMLVYLFAVCAAGGARYAAANTAPAGVLYLTAKDITAKNAHVPLDTKRLKPLCMNGLLLRDDDVLDAMDSTGEGCFIPAERKKGEMKCSSAILPEDFAVIQRLTETLLKQMAERLLDGDIAAVPTGEGESLPCRYCEYAAICRREEDDPAVYMQGGKTAEVMKAIREEVLPHG